MIILNANDNKPVVFYGLHMASGVAEYKDLEMRILIEDEVINAMAPSFIGLPVYVDHQKPDYSRLRETADGYVAESFFNKADGKHWVKFIVITKEAKEAILMKKWKLSNAYKVKRKSGGGSWHGVDYDQLVLEGEYDHLAIVSEPRYAESIILTPEEFKKYNAEKEAELLRVANSKDKPKETAKKVSRGDSVMFFKKEKMDDAVDLKNTIVALPKSGREVSLETLINEADEKKQNESKPQYADVKHLVKVGDKEMTVNDLVESFSSMTKKNEADKKDESKKENQDDKEKKENTSKEDKENEDDKEEKKNKKKNSKSEDDKENEDDKEEVKKNSVDHFNTLSNANKTNKDETFQNTISTSADRVQRGRELF